MSIALPNSFDDFMSSENSEEKTEEKKESVDSIYKKERLEWHETIKGMTVRMKDILEIQNLMVDVYTERQRAIEYYHYLISLLIGINKQYRRKYAERFKHYTDSIQFRVNKEQITNLINNDLEALSINREKLENHAKFMENTTKSIDGIIFGIKHRIEVEQIIRGK